MSTTLKEIINAVEAFKIYRNKTPKESIADSLLGKYKGVIPKGKTSTQFIRTLRNTLYGKIR